MGDITNKDGSSEEVPAPTRRTRGDKLQEMGSSLPGWKRYYIQDQVFEIPERYKLCSCIGKGAFGVVCLYSHMHASCSVGSWLVASMKHMIP